MHFDGINATLRASGEGARGRASRSIWRPCSRFAARAYRRPLSKAEREDLLAYYRDAAQEERTVARRRDPRLPGQRPDVAGFSVPHRPGGCHRGSFEPRASPAAKPAAGAMAAALQLRPGEPAELLPVVQHAGRGVDCVTRRRATCASRPSCWQQTRRMLKDERVSGLATEFAGNWLDFRHFETNNTVDRERFPSFNNELRRGHVPGARSASSKM